MKAIIFGISGQDGFYLNKILQQNNIEVIGVSRSNGNWHKGSVSDFHFTEEVIKTNKPDYIFHLAAKSTTKHDAIFENHETIATGTLNILEAAYRHCRQAKVFLSGSAVQFENKGVPIDEETPFSATNPYAVSRIQSVYAGRYFQGLGLNVYIGYFFHHDSPIRTEAHINQHIVQTVLRIKNGSNEQLLIGNTGVRKEFNFAGDLVQAVWLLVNQSQFFECVIGSGEAYSIEEWIKLCFEKVGIPDWEKHISIKTDFVPEFQLLVSNPARIMSTGWRPSFNMEGLASLMLNHE